MITVTSEITQLASRQVNPVNTPIVYQYVSSVAESFSVDYQEFFNYGFVIEGCSIDIASLVGMKHILV